LIDVLMRSKVGWFPKAATLAPTLFWLGLTLCLPRGKP